ncbi:GNAT family acetyltransferase [Ktedonobacter sp. SOSP1-85]|uniref:GNAT family N-acetyltransferase n=1 Tax=Ktedonobacter sp. SOSP1-85 TaxID=2778367 RepID=UPI001916855F|nr:GNAT family N-acetyltransferase [Ktedonobacter sp. SOSP1-85]GHO78484.1 GNAT family acetyltransferase [Ktedonobacter sp. SOSP1-85]
MLQKEKTMETFSTRPATEADIPQLCPLYWDFHLYHVVGLPDWLRMPDRVEVREQQTGELAKGLRDIIQREDAAILMAEQADGIIGFVEVYLREDEVHPLRVAHRYGYVQSLFVTEACRKTGCGRALMQAAHDWARARGAIELQLESWDFAAGPLRFYEKLGYRTVKRQMVVTLS